jgi:hypothetical protein
MNNYLVPLNSVPGGGLIVPHHPKDKSADDKRQEEGGHGGIRPFPGFNRFVAGRLLERARRAGRGVLTNGGTMGAISRLEDRERIRNRNQFFMM